MLLYSETFGHRKRGCSAPTLVFLHGLLGSGRDWRDVVNHLAADHFCVTVDLPGHGQSRQVLADGFAEVNQYLSETLNRRGVGEYVLIGYSLGARLAIYHACQSALVLSASVKLGNTRKEPESAASTTPNKVPKLVGLVLEGGNFGLPENERAARLLNDQRWAKRFVDEPISQVLADWYLQPVFSSLNHDQRQSLQIKRSDNLGCSVAHMLLATSLAKQPDLLPYITQLCLPVEYVCGEDDTKFTCLAIQSGLSFSAIPDAGHNVHVEQPYWFSMALIQYLSKHKLSKHNLSEHN